MKEWRQGTFEGHTCPHCSSHLDLCRFCMGHLHVLQIRICSDCWAVETLRLPEMWLGPLSKKPWVFQSWRTQSYQTDPRVGSCYTSATAEFQLGSLKALFLSDRKQPKSGCKGSSLAAYNEKGHLESIHLTFRGLLCALFEKLWPTCTVRRGFSLFNPRGPSIFLDQLGILGWTLDGNFAERRHGTRLVWGFGMVWRSMKGRGGES